MEVQNKNTSENNEQKVSDVECQVIETEHLDVTLNNQQTEHETTQEALNSKDGTNEDKCPLTTEMTEHSLISVQVDTGENNSIETSDCNLNVTQDTCTLEVVESLKTVDAQKQKDEAEHVIQEPMLNEVPEGTVSNSSIGHSKEEHMDVSPIDRCWLKQIFIKQSNTKQDNYNKCFIKRYY